MNFNKGLLVLVMLQSFGLMGAEAAEQDDKKELWQVQAEQLKELEDELASLNALGKDELKRLFANGQLTKSDIEKKLSQLALHIFDTHERYTRLDIETFCKKNGISKEILSKQQRLATELVDAEDQSKVDALEQWTPMHWAAYKLAKECRYAKETYTGPFRERNWIDEATFIFVQDVASQLKLPLNAKTTYTADDGQTYTVAVHEGVVNKFSQQGDLSRVFFNVYKGIHAAGGGLAEDMIMTGLKQLYGEGDFIVQDVKFMRLNYE